MADRLPRVTAVQVVRALHRDGWIDDRQLGSHLVLLHPRRGGRVVVPMHRGKILQPRTLSDILKQAGLTPDDLRRLL